MRLENLYPNFGKSSPEAQARYVADYRLKRAEDMAKTPTWPKQKKTTTSTKAPPLTEEEKIVMKLLGLTKKEIIALRSLSIN
jgi:hypothetical protein